MLAAMEWVAETGRYAVLATADNHVSTTGTTDLLCSLALFTRPQVVVEAGTYAGHTALAIAYFLQQAGVESHLWTADTEDRYNVGFPTVLGHVGLQDRVTFWHGDFAEMLTVVPGEIDLVYLDASGVAEPDMRWRHFQAVWPRVRQFGCVAIDDCAGDWPHAQEFREMGNCYLPTQRGLAVFQKR